jgi:ABC-type oligopeptide transport system ATPase subunit
VLNYDLSSSEKEFELLETEFMGESQVANPFPGLRPFGLEESHLYFGREGQVDEVLLKLAEHKFITLLGYSGSGKSSLMYCGLIPILYGGFMTAAGADWNVVVTRPGFSPLDNLAESLIQQDPVYKIADEEDRLIKKTVASAILRGGSAGLIDIARQYKALTGDNLLLLVDQFEELFRFRNDEDNGQTSEEAALFVELLLEAVNQDEVPIYVAITMRSDFIGESSKYPGLTELINKSSYVIPQMTREQKRMAIEGPVAVGGGKISARLVKRLLNDIGDDQDQLPILQHALMRTWDYWLFNRERGEEIDIRHYNAVGRIDEALSQHADEAYDELSDKHKRIAEILFKNLTEKGADNYGIRRPSTVNEIARVGDVDESDVIEVVDHFRSPGRSLLMPPANVDLTSDSIIEISHESLMRIWTRLHNWVDEEHESAQMYKRISEAAAMYQIGRTGLWRPPDLQLALNWQQKQSPTRFWAQRYDEAFERAIVFLDTSRITYEAEQKSQELMQKRVLKRARRVAIILGIAAIISILMFVLALTNQIEANKQRLVAENSSIKANESAQLAEERRQEAEAATAEAVKSAEEARIAQQAAEEANTQLQVALTRARNAVAAEAAARQLAQSQTEAAETASQFAEQQTEIAVAARDDANRLLILSTAQTLALKSLQEKDANLKGLMAQQAFLFNDEYEGKDYDRFIYDGVYHAMANFEGDMFNVYSGHRGAVKAITFEKNTGNFFSTGSDGRILKWDMATPGQEPIVLAESEGVSNRDVAISPDGKWLMSSSDSSALKLYDLSNPDKAPQIIEGHKGFVYDLKAMPDGSGFISIGYDQTLRFYDFNRSRLLKQLEYPLRTIDISSNGNWIFGGSLQGELIKITMQDMSEEVLYASDIKEPIYAVEMSHDEKWIAFGAADYVLRLWDFEKGMVTNELQGHSSRISDIDFSYNGELMASASWDGKVHLWYMNNLDDLSIILQDNFESYVWDVDFSPDDNYIIVGTRSDLIKRWPVKASLYANEICEKVSRNMSLEEWERYVGNGIEFRNTCIRVLIESDR